MSEPAPRFATIDVGTNSVLLLVAERAGDGGFAAVLERMEITRLGRGVDRTHRLDPQAIEETVAAVRTFAAEARAAGATQIACVATSAARDASNGAAFFTRVAAEAGVTVETIPGHDEAALSFEAAARDFADGRPMVVIDIGGGSTEFIYGARKPDFSTSLDLGSVRMTERFLHSDPPTALELAALNAAVDAALAPLPAPPPGARVVGIAGTITTLAAVKQRLVHYDGARVHGSELTHADLASLVRRLSELTEDERRGVAGIPPKRADVIVAGAAIAERALARLGAGTMTVSDRGVRWGLLYRRFGQNS